MGFLYVIQSCDSDRLHKIGITKNWEKRRIALKVEVKTVQKLLVQLPDELEKKIEKELHKQFTEHRLPQSEWFFLEYDKYIKLKSAINVWVVNYGAKIVFDFEEKTSEKGKADGEIDKKIEAFEGHYDWLINDVYDNFLEELHSYNPFLYNFDVEKDFDVDGFPMLNAYVCFIEPTNTICTLQIICDYNSTKEDVEMYLAQPDFCVNTDPKREERGKNWYAENYGSDEIDLDEYLEILFERLSILKNSSQELWPSKVFAGIVQRKQDLEKFLAKDEERMAKLIGATDETCL